MASTFITKRPHKKSRGGCQTCKVKKVKCDEVQPQCTYCSIRHLTCIYTAFRPRASQSRSASPPQHGYQEAVDFNVVEIPNFLAPAVLTSSGPMPPREVPLMHHYSTYTWSSLSTRHDAPTDRVMGLVVPQLAFENDFLLHAILGIASAHKHYLCPSADQQKETDDLRVKTLRGIRQALLHLSPKNYEAVLVTSLLLAVLSSRSNIEGDDELCVVNWMTLYAGVNIVVDLRHSASIRGEKMSILPLLHRTFDQVADTPTVPQALLDMLASIGPQDPDFAYLEPYYTTIGCLGLLYTSLRKEGLGPEHSQRVVSWPSLIPEEFPILARQYAPRALIILAHYLLFTKLMTEAWWLDGIADREINVIANIVGEEWRSMMDVPLRATRLSNPDDVVRLILAPSRCSAPDVSAIVADIETWVLEEPTTVGATRCKGMESSNVAQ